jgi:flagellar basal-body rod protein FlgB
MSLFDLLGSSATDSLEHVIGFAAKRHEVFAHNIANIDTPGFRVRDLDSKKFNQTLARAIERSSRANPNVSRLDLPSVQQLDGSPRAHRPAEAEHLRGIVFHDDNDRSIEKLMVEMTKNADRHARAASLLRSQINLLRSIISENPQ